MTTEVSFVICRARSTLKNGRTPAGMWLVSYSQIMIVWFVLKKKYQFLLVLAMWTEAGFW
jgi:hypothetical protein